MASAFLIQKIQMRVVPNKHGNSELLLNSGQFKIKTTYVLVNTTLYVWTNAKKYYQYITRTHLSKVLESDHLIVEKLSPYQTTWLHQVLQNVILTIGGTTDCVIGGRCVAKQVTWHMVQLCEKPGTCLGSDTGSDTCSSVWGIKKMMQAIPFIYLGLWWPNWGPLFPLPNWWCEHWHSETTGGVVWSIWVWGLECEQELIPYVGQLELSNVSVEGRIIDPY